MAFLENLAPHGERWKDCLQSTPPALDLDQQVVGLWADAMYAAVVFEHANKNWSELPGYEDNGPAGHVLEYLEQLGHSRYVDCFAKHEEWAHEAVETPVDNPGAFMRLKCRNGKTWFEYVQGLEPLIKDGIMAGGWGECLTAAVIFEHQNPGWAECGAFVDNGPAGQVLFALEQCGHEVHLPVMYETEQQTHQAIDEGRNVPIFKASDYQAYQVPIGLQDAHVSSGVQELSGRKKAVLVCCNYPGSSAELRGCVNDGLRWKEQLLKQGFPEDQIVLLRDDGQGKPSTRNNSVNSIRWLVDGSRPGDVLFFQFSGHGSQVTLPYSNEEDGLDEVIIPTDYNEAGYITDNELYDMLCMKLPAGVRLTVVLDCCHSGSALDLPYHWIGNNQWEMEDQPAKSRGDVQMFSGCDDDQCSADAYNKRAQAYSGALSNAFCDLLDQNPNNLSYEDLFNDLSNLLRERGFEQRPQMTSMQAFKAEDYTFSLCAQPLCNRNEQVGFSSTGAGQKSPNPNLAQQEELFGIKF